MIPLSSSKIPSHLNDQPKSATNCAHTESRRDCSIQLIPIENSSNCSAKANDLTENFLGKVSKISISSEADSKPVAVEDSNPDTTKPDVDLSITPHLSPTAPLIPYTLVSSPLRRSSKRKKSRPITPVKETFFPSIYLTPRYSNHTSCIPPLKKLRCTYPAPISCSPIIEKSKKLVGLSNSDLHGKRIDEIPPDDTSSAGITASKILDCRFVIGSSSRTSSTFPLMRRQMNRKNESRSKSRGIPYIPSSPCSKNLNEL
mmetsp:Transcript_10259/g.15754  ORF Transcript_10259/g.15754 Transcript_10259/m.15754 type:complete len:258 (+) Transcript_10259:302-1075(+)